MFITSIEIRDRLQRTQYRSVVLKSYFGKYGLIINNYSTEYTKRSLGAIR